MRTTEINKSALQTTGTLVPDGPVYMLNLLRYKEYADYNNPAGPSPCSGREVYMQRYVREFNRIAAGHGVKLLFLGNVGVSLVAPDTEQWDDIAIVEYPDFFTFRHIVDSNAYLTDAEPHRLAALEDWRLIATNKISL
ncbi:hypothetical protein [Chitinophaga sp. CF418]|uniref:hypothetical protein n=1 Tax=Chitinophaga sp. CF418 TaxID=1855287 RepID=UPI00091F63D2|nr:hypothetical protein [Chitinophaga sp. CF418]SHN33112.1 hypothetical protein SAMN05216311_109143 [Chitinophaga sp. CF418]